MPSANFQGEIMISFTVNDARFNLRAAAIIERKAAVLLHRMKGDDFWALPGGRVEMGESGAQTIVRELQEELGEVVSCHELRYLVENFFSRQGKAVHEIGLYYSASLLPDSVLPYRQGAFDGIEPDVDLEYAWFERSALSELVICPLLVKDLLMEGRRDFVHAVQRE